MKLQKIFMFDKIIPFNSTMVEEDFENLDLDMHKMQWNFIKYLSLNKLFLLIPACLEKVFKI